MEKAALLEHIKGLGNVYEISSSFDKQILALRKKGTTSPISIRDAAYARLHGNKSNRYTRTCHAPIYAKDSPTIVARMSPLVRSLRLAEQAVNAHGNNRYLIFNDDNSIYSKWEKIAKADEAKRPEKRRAIILPSRQDYRFNKYSLEANFFFEDMEKPYFSKFVPSNGIPIWQIPEKEVDDSLNGTIINYVGFYTPEDGSCLYFRRRNLSYDGRALGVQNRSAEGTSKKISEVKLPYTNKQINSNLRIIEKIRAGQIKIGDLESQVSKLEEFLKSLKQ